jgi:hypothetical protein
MIARQKQLAGEAVPYGERPITEDSSWAVFTPPLIRSEQDLPIAERCMLARGYSHQLQKLVAIINTSFSREQQPIVGRAIRHRIEGSLWN